MDGGTVTGSGTTLYGTTPGWSFTIDGVHEGDSVRFTVQSQYQPFDFAGAFDPSDGDVVDGEFTGMFSPTDTQAVTLRRQ